MNLLFLANRNMFGFGFAAVAAVADMPSAIIVHCIYSAFDSRGAFGVAACIATVNGGKIELPTEI